MRILVDADACPVKEIILEEAKKRNIELLMLFDSSHIYEDDYSKVLIVDKGFDSVDYKLLSLSQKDDLVITQDYGLSAMALTKDCHVLHINGFVIDQNNIDSLLNTRYIGAMIRKSGKYTKGPKKRSNETDLKFKEALIRLLDKREINI